MGTMPMECIAESRNGAAASRCATDMYVAVGFVGTLDLRGGCHTAYEVFGLAARDIARRGDVGAVKALLSSGRLTVRGLLTERYGIYLGPREYWHSPRITPDEADRVGFLRILKNAKSDH